MSSPCQISFSSALSLLYSTALRFSDSPVHLGLCCSRLLHLLLPGPPLASSGRLGVYAAVKLFTCMLGPNAVCQKGTGELGMGMGPWDQDCINSNFSFTNTNQNVQVLWPLHLMSYFRICLDNASINKRQRGKQTALRINCLSGLELPPTTYHPPTPYSN